MHVCMYVFMYVCGFLIFVCRFACMYVCVGMYVCGCMTSAYMSFSYPCIRFLNVVPCIANRVPYELLTNQLERERERVRAPLLRVRQFWQAAEAQ